MCPPAGAPLPALMAFCFRGSFVGLCAREGIEGSLPTQAYIASVQGTRLCRVHVWAEQALLPKISDKGTGRMWT